MSEEINFQFARGRELGEAKRNGRSSEMNFQFARGRELGDPCLSGAGFRPSFQFARGRELGEHLAVFHAVHRLPICAWA